jgi:hypothetical protein
VIFRTIVVACSAILLATQVVRNAAVNALAGFRPSEATRFWSSHPAAELSLGMTEIARASRSRRPVPASAFVVIEDAATKEPLAPEPFLVRGVQAQLAGDSIKAQRAFEEAQWRDPRSLPAAYFLADRYFQTGDSVRGLREVAILARLAPRGTGTFAPYLAAYATNPANWPKLRQLFNGNPDLADPTLNKLASDPQTVPAVLALANPGQKDRSAPWLPPLLNSLVVAGQYGQARAIWDRVSGVPIGSGGLMYDTGFTDRASPPPFNWTFTSSTVGVAERQRGGRLHVVFYGQEDGMLATQLLLLPPGKYRLSMQLLGDPSRARALVWSVWCDKADAPIASVTLDAVAAKGWTFQVPAKCSAQWLKLSGSSSDLSQQSDVSVAGLKLEKVADGA